VPQPMTWAKTCTMDVGKEAVGERWVSERIREEDPNDGVGKSKPHEHMGKGTKEYPRSEPG
jgi:hypothetical protein